MPLASLRATAMPDNTENLVNKLDEAIEILNQAKAMIEELPLNSLPLRRLTTKFTIIERHVIEFGELTTYIVNTV